VPVFLNSEIELRPGWRFFAYVLTYVVLFQASGALMSVLIPGPVADFGQLRGLALSTLTFLPPAVFTFWFMLRFVDRSPPAAFGITLHEGWVRDCGVGLATAAGMVLVYLGGAAAASSTVVHGASTGSLPAIGMTIVLLVVAAASEELVYRGYPLQVLLKATGPSPVPGVLLMSAVFGLGHYLNPNATWLGTFNTFLAGVLLSIAYLRTRSLWLPYGIHIGWNLGVGVVLGLPVSGVHLSSILETGVGEPDWLTGGGFGPEGGILATVAIIAAALVVARTRRVGISGTVRRARGRKSAGKSP